MLQLPFLQQFVVSTYFFCFETISLPVFPSSVIAPLNQLAPMMTNISSCRMLTRADRPDFAKTQSLFSFSFFFYCRLFYRRVAEGPSLNFLKNKQVISWSEIIVYIILTTLLFTINVLFHKPSVDSTSARLILVVGGTNISTFSNNHTVKSTIDIKTYASKTMYLRSKSVRDLSGLRPVDSVSQSYGSP